MGSDIRERGHKLGTHGRRAELAFEQVRDLIVRGRFKADEKLTEGRVSEWLGISRTPVRDALSRLAREGFLVASTRGRRTELMVSRLSASDVVELWGLMGALEGFSIQVISDFEPARSRALASSLGEINDELLSALGSRPWDHEVVAELMSRFHICFMDECAGERVLQIYRTLRPHVERYEWVYGTQVSADYRLSTDEHLEIIAAVEISDGQLARKLIEQHWAADIPRTSAKVTAAAPAFSAGTRLGG